jgi:hypothetical protein
MLYYSGHILKILTRVVSYFTTAMFIQQFWVRRMFYGSCMFMFLGGIRKENIRISKWVTKLLKTFSTWDGSGGVVSAADTVVAGPADALDEVVNLNILVEH